MQVTVALSALRNYFKLLIFYKDQDYVKNCKRKVIHSEIKKNYYFSACVEFGKDWAIDDAKNQMCPSNLTSCG